jgi:hypothetical protein
MKRHFLFAIFFLSVAACSLSAPSFDPTISQGPTNCFTRTTLFETTLGHASVTILAIGVGEQLATVVVHDDRGPVFDGRVTIVNPSLFGNRPQITVYRRTLDPPTASDSASSLANRGLYALQTQCHPVALPSAPILPY